MSEFQVYTGREMEARLEGSTSALRDLTKTLQGNNHGQFNVNRRLVRRKSQKGLLCCGTLQNEYKGLPRSTKRKDVWLRQEDESATCWNDNV